MFSDLGQGVLDNAWQGYNAALFAYGQTGSGKSYSMIGYGANKGIVPITCEELFNVIETNKDDKKQLRVGVLCPVKLESWENNLGKSITHENKCARSVH